MKLGNIESVISRIETLSLPDLTVTKKFSSRIAPYVGNKLGSGGSASIVKELNIPGLKESLVLKITTPCKFRGEVFLRYCSDLLDINSIRHYPHGEKELIELPNPVMEGIIGGILKRIVDMNHSPHFAPVYGVWVDPNEAVVYTMSPRYETDLSQIIRTHDDIYYILFQIAQGLSVAQELYHFTHYDLHHGNIFYQKESINRSYPLANENGTTTNFVLKSRGYTIKIADYGLSRLETTGTVINATVDDFPIRSRGHFNRYYDMVSIVGSLLYSPDIPLITNLPDKVRADIYSIIFGLDARYILDDITDFETSIYTLVQDKSGDEVIWWRPKGFQEILYIPAPNIHAVTRGLARKLVEGQSYSEKVLPLDRYDLVGHYEIEEPLPEIRQKGISIAPGIDIRTYMYEEDQLPKITSWTRTASEIKNCPQRLQYIHYVAVNTKLAAQNGYKVKLECCKYDTKSYFDDKFGVAINGTYFDIRRGYVPKPIGPYQRYPQNEDKAAYISNHPEIPFIYKKYYGCIIVNDNGLSIARKPTALNDNYAFSGPMLVENGKIVFTDDDLKSEYDLSLLSDNDRQFLGYPSQGSFLPFQCREDPVKSTSSTSRLISPSVEKKPTGFSCQPSILAVSEYIPNCSQIRPGELSHAGNSNPRSMLLTRDGSDGKGDLVLIYVEGRDDRGVGYDLADLAKLAKQFGAINAINLDGGRSSSIAWRTEQDPDVVYTANPNHKNAYTVGNLIAISK